MPDEAVKPLAGAATPAGVLVPMGDVLEFLEGLAMVPEGFTPFRVLDTVTTLDDPTLDDVVVVCRASKGRYIAVMSDGQYDARLEHIEDASGRLQEWLTIYADEKIVYKNGELMDDDDIETFAFVQNCKHQHSGRFPYRGMQQPTFVPEGY